MFRKISGFIGFIMLGVIFTLTSASGRRAEPETGVLSIFFAGEKVGYEEYEWREEETGFSLSVRGKMNKPIALEISALSLRLDRSYIPMEFRFKGIVSGMAQELKSSFDEGQVKNILRINGQNQTISAKVRRDALILPNPIFAPYMVLTKKYRCDLKDRKELAAYIIPQVEVPFVLEPGADSACTMVMIISGNPVELDTDETGRLIELRIPSQSLRVTRVQKSR